MLKTVHFCYYNAPPFMILDIYTFTRRVIFVTSQLKLSNFMNALRTSKKQYITKFSEDIGISRSEMLNILKCNCFSGSRDHFNPRAGKGATII